MEEEDLILFKRVHMNKHMHWCRSIHGLPSVLHGIGCLINGLASYQINKTTLQLYAAFSILWKVIDMYNFWVHLTFQ